MAAYHGLRQQQVPTRRAASLTGVCFVNFKSAISALRIRPPRHVSRPFQQLAIS